MKYVLKFGGKIIEGITIDESAKEYFKEMMGWSEEVWNDVSEELTPSETK